VGAEHVFLGSSQHTIDDKGRLTLPAKWRDELSSGVVVTRGLDDCIFIFAQPRFESMAHEIDMQGFEGSDAREWGRYLFALAEMVEIDKQGRILLPQNLRTNFGLNGEVMVVGLNSRIEVWNPDKYKEMTKRVTSDPAGTAERMRQLIRGTHP
jgi:MraZ protein